MNKDEFIELLKSYDFIKNSVQSFCHKYNINPKTVRKYLQENNIEYNKRTIIVEIKRDANGRYSRTTDSVCNSTINHKIHESQTLLNKNDKINNSDHRSEPSRIDIDNMACEEKLKHI